MAWRVHVSLAVEHEGKARLPSPEPPLPRLLSWREVHFPCVAVRPVRPGTCGSRRQPPLPAFCLRSAGVLPGRPRSRGTHSGLPGSSSGHRQGNSELGAAEGECPSGSPPRGPFGNLGPTSLTPTLAGRHHMPAPSLPPTPVALLPSPSTRPHASASALHTPPVPSHSLVAGEGAGILFALQRHFLCIRAVPSRFRCGCSAPALGGTPWACGQHPGTCTGLAPALLHSCDLDGREQQPSPSRAPFPHCLGFRGCSLTSSSAPPPPMQLLIRPIS